MPRVKRGAANNEACNYKRKRRPKTQRWVVRRGALPRPSLLCSALPAAAVLLAPCHTENVHILKREKDDKYFLKRVATELCPRQQEWAGWGDWEAGGWVAL